MTRGQQLLDGCTLAKLPNAIFCKIFWKGIHLQQSSDYERRYGIILVFVLTMGLFSECINLVTTDQAEITYC